MKKSQHYVGHQITSPRSIYLNCIVINFREMIKHLPYNQKIDIWAFGCILHHMATGYNPFEVF